MRCSRIKQNNNSSGVDLEHTKNSIGCLRCFIHCHIVDPAANKVLPSYHSSGVTIPIRDCVGSRHLVGVVAQLGTSTSEVSFLTTIESPPICTGLWTIYYLYTF
jgi:hypothetical protein